MQTIGKTRGAPFRDSIKSLILIRAAGQTAATCRNELDGRLRRHCRRLQCSLFLFHLHVLHNLRERAQLDMHHLTRYFGAMSNTKTRLSVTLDPKALEEAVKRTGVSSKRQAVEQAVNELLQTRRRKTLADLIGTGIFGVTEAGLRKRRHQRHATK